MNLRLSLLSIILTLIPAFAGATDSADAVRPCDRKPMSVYIWHGCMRDSDYVSRIDFANFDNVYLMDGALWQSVEEFDRDIAPLLDDPEATVPFRKRDRFAQCVSLAHEAGTKAMWSLGNECRFQAFDNERRERFSRIVAQTVRNMDFDGVDIDWETDVYTHHDLHAQLLAALRAALDSLTEITGKKYTLSTALSVEAHYREDCRQTLNDAVDFINLMSYDLGGCLWREYATHNTPMAGIEKSVDEHWKGIPREKLHLGLANYGFLYKSIFPGERLPDGKRLNSCGRYINYNAVMPQIMGDQNWRKVYDPEEKSYYFLNDADHSFITIETPETLAHKFEYVSRAGLGGTFWWCYANDVMPDNNGGRHWRHMLIPVHRQLKDQD